MVKLNALNEPSKLFLIFRQNADKVVIANLDFDACPRTYGKKNNIKEGGLFWKNDVVYILCYFCSLFSIYGLTLVELMSL